MSTCHTLGFLFREKESAAREDNWYRHHRSRLYGKAAQCRHGTGYQDQLIIEARDFLAAIQAGQSQWPSFRDGMEVNRVIEAVWASCDNSSWVEV